VRGQPLLKRLVGTMQEAGVRDITVVRGYAKEAVALPGVATVDNDAYETTGELASLAVALDRLRGNALVVYGDVLFRRYILDGLLEAEGDIAVAVDALWHDRDVPRPRVRDLVAADRRFSSLYLDEAPARLAEIGPEIAASRVAGEFIGLVRFSPAGAELARDEMQRLEAEGRLADGDIPLLLTRLAARAPVTVHYVTGHWLDVDDLADLADARNFP
jgi:phosphoenolpyruvate phosphomutase